MCFEGKVIKSSVKVFNQQCARARSYYLVRADCKRLLLTLCSARSHSQLETSWHLHERNRERVGMKLCLTSESPVSWMVGGFNLHMIDGDRSSLTINSVILRICKNP